ncbi:MAG: hypothetical protein AAF674_20895 [Pseudomonadota bacterium]
MKTRTVKRLAAGFLSVVAAGVGPDASAQTKAELIEMCAEQMVQTFGEVEVEFNKIRREESRKNVFGEIAMADGSTRRIRCRVQRGKVRGVMFRNEGGGAGNFWNDRLPDGEFATPSDEALEPDDQPGAEDGAQTTPDSPDTEAEVEDQAETDQAAAPADPEAEASAGGTEPDSDTDAETAAEEEAPDPTAPKRIRVPSN